MIDEIRSLPDIKNSDNVIDDYNIFRNLISRKESQTKDLFLVIASRFLDDYNYYIRLIEKKSQQ